MQLDLESLCQQIIDCHIPEELFGVHDVHLPPEAMLSFLEKEYLKLKSPLDTGLADLEFRDLAHDASRKLEQLREKATAKIKRFHYGMYGYDQPRPSAHKNFSLGANRYLVGASTRRSELAEWFQGYLEHDGEYLGEVEIKLADTVSDNQYLTREARAIDLLHQTPVPQWKHLPCLLDRFETNGRNGLIFRKQYGVSLTTVRKKRVQVNGVDQKHIAWMLDRTLSALGYVHRCGLIHGALSPDTLIINDRMHNVTLSEWGHSALNPARSGERVIVINEEHDPFLAPEVIAAQQVGPWSDIYALGKTMIWCIGGDPMTNSIPHRVEESFGDFLLRMVAENPDQRSSDCWQLHEEQCRIKDALWPRKFQHLDLS